MTSPIASTCQFIDVTPGGSGAVVGSIPVWMNTDYYWDIDAYDPDGDPLTYSLEIKPDDTATIDPETGEVYWYPAAEGDYDFRVAIEDGRGGRITKDWTVEVRADHSNSAPEFIDTQTPDPSTALSAQVGREFVLQVQADDPDGDELEYALVSGTFPTGAGDAQMQIDRNTGRITWTPSTAQVGTWGESVTVRVVDRRGGVDKYTFQLDVAGQDIAINHRPEIDPIARDPRGRGRRALPACPST